MADGAAFLEALGRVAKLYAPAAQRVHAEHRDVCSWLLGPLERWTLAAYGAEAFDRAARGYAEYCLHVSKSQKRYETEGRYASQDVGGVFDDVYDNAEYMTGYMWAAILVYAFWPSMIPHIALYRDAFLAELPEKCEMLELACGHGVMGLLASEYRLGLRTTGFDISPTAIDIASHLASASGLADRATFSVRDVLDPAAQGEPHRYQGVLAAMVAEHLMEPRKLFASVAHHLAEDGLAFVGNAIESAQSDHVYEFHQESEAVLMAEEVGLRVVRLISDRGQPIRGGRFVPRAQAMILEHRR